ncbi:MAG TPA: hypothetical protein PKA74_14570, partial [Bauldia sp.]|nr:hypothetical protein [Bauldia sp.]
RETLLRRPVAEPEPPLSEEPELAAVFPTRAPRAVEPPAPEPEPEAEPAFPAMEDESPSTVPDIEPPPMTPVSASAFAPPRHRPIPERATAEDEDAAAVADMEPEEPAAPAAPAPKVSDLEKEMARLLGEISSSRSS